MDDRCTHSCYSKLFHESIVEINKIPPISEPAVDSTGDASVIADDFIKTPEKENNVEATVDAPKTDSTVVADPSEKKVPENDIELIKNQLEEIEKKL